MPRERLDLNEVIRDVLVLVAARRDWRILCTSACGFTPSRATPHERVLGEGRTPGAILALKKGYGFSGTWNGRKLRVLASWTLDLLFGTEIEQLVTLRDVDAVTHRLDRIRARDKRRVALASRHTP